MATIRRSPTAAALLLRYLILPGVSTMIFRSFSCEEFDELGKFFRADYAMECDVSKNAEFKTLTIYSMIMVIIYPVGIALLYAATLFRSRKREKRHIKRSVATTSVSFLTYSYPRECRYFELFECFRRLC